MKALIVKAHCAPAVARTSAVNVGPITWPGMNWSESQADGDCDLVARHQSRQDRDARRLGNRAGRVEREGDDHQMQLGDLPGERERREATRQAQRQDVRTIQGGPDTY